MLLFFCKYIFLNFIYLIFFLRAFTSGMNSFHVLYTNLFECFDFALNKKEIFIIFNYNIIKIMIVQRLFKEKTNY